MRSLLLAVLALGTGFPKVAEAQASCSRPAEACAFFNTFLTALNHRDWPAFRQTLDDSISIFLEEPAPPQRFDERFAAESLFARIFPQPGVPQSPLPQALVPEHLPAQDFGSVVIVTFELSRPQARARRTVVLTRGQTGWHIVHIHGSALPTTGG